MLCKLKSERDDLILYSLFSVISMYTKSKLTKKTNIEKMRFHKIFPFVTLLFSHTSNASDVVFL